MIYQFVALCFCLLMYSTSSKSKVKLSQKGFLKQSLTSCKINSLSNVCQYLIFPLCFTTLIDAYLHICVVAGLVACTGMSDVLFKLLQTVQHCLSQQLTSSGCSSDTAFTCNRPQLLNTGMQPGQVTTNLLKIERYRKRKRDERER